MRSMEAIEMAAATVTNYLDEIGRKDARAGAALEALTELLAHVVDLEEAVGRVRIQRLDDSGRLVARPAVAPVYYDNSDFPQDGADE